MSDEIKEKMSDTLDVIEDITDLCGGALVLKRMAANLLEEAEDVWQGLESCRKRLKLLEEFLAKEEEKEDELR